MEAECTKATFLLRKDRTWAAMNLAGKYRITGHGGFEWVAIANAL